MLTLGRANESSSAGREKKRRHSEQRETNNKYISTREGAGGAELVTSQSQWRKIMNPSTFWPEAPGLTGVRASPVARGWQGGREGAANC